MPPVHHRNPSSTLAGTVLAVGITTAACVNAESSQQDAANRVSRADVTVTVDPARQLAVVAPHAFGVFIMEVLPYSAVTVIIPAAA